MVYLRAALLSHQSSADTTEVLNTLTHSRDPAHSKTRCETVLYSLHEAARGC